jgi:lipid-A-disaccharide synthase
MRRWGTDLHIKLYSGQSTDVMIASDGVLLASGTAALEAMLLNRPMVVSYRLTALTFRIMKAMATTPWVSLPNILTQSEWVPERLQDEATPARLSEDLIMILTDTDYRDQFEQRSRFLHRQLARGADEQAAAAVLAVACVEDK